MTDACHPRRTTRLGHALAWAAGVALFAALLAGVHGYGARLYGAELEEKGRASAELHRQIIRGWLDRYRALAPIYAHSPEIVRLLRWPQDGVQVELVNTRLEALNSASGASDTYVLDRGGNTIAASNWNEAISFIGKNFSFRPYFTEAMQGRLGRYFALGTTSGKRGYYFAFPVRDGGPAIGAVVVKVPVDRIEQELRASQNEVFVTDAAGVILLAGHPEWRMKTIHALSEEAISEISARRQFDPELLRPAPISGLSGADANLVRAVPDRSGVGALEFLHLSEAMTVEGWTLHLLLPTAEVRQRTLTLVLLVGALAAMLVLGLLLVRQRRRRLADRLAERDRAEAALERAVAERTADLRKTQSELVQAGKLAALGQMSAALSHEFNQPLAAVRSYAENAVAFLERGKQAQAEENLTRIARLTERMAQLSKHLTSFARKPKDSLEPVSLDAVLDEALSLMAGRIERAGAQIERLVPPGLMVIGGPTRLQHVLMNLLGNALDASADRTPPLIRLTGAAEGEAAWISVEDNGTGIAPEVMDTLFDPFVSTKAEGKGLGLGLSISYNIVRDFGGTIRAENIAGGGARLIVTLALAERTVEAAE